MRLINVDTLELELFFGDNTPPYAILSHTWEAGEVTFQDWQNPQESSRQAGCAKIKGACEQTREYGLSYLWVDTNCIDKTSSAELSEAINSMFGWYKEAKICFAYLVDIEGDEDFGRSRWFTRGWTLQELLAPTQIFFFNRDWRVIGTRDNLSQLISIITRIRPEYLRGDGSFFNATVATRMSWMANRTATRQEDMAYCLLGIFDINMPLLYGEGEKAFVRLQEEIVKISADMSVHIPVVLGSSTVFTAEFLEDIPRIFSIRPLAMTNAGITMDFHFYHTFSASLAFVVLDFGRVYKECESFVTLPMNIGKTASGNKELHSRARWPCDPGQTPKYQVAGLRMTSVRLTPMAGWRHQSSIPQHPHLDTLGSGTNRQKGKYFFTWSSCDPAVGMELTTLIPRRTPTRQCIFGEHRIFDGWSSTPLWDICVVMIKRINLSRNTHDYVGLFVARPDPSPQTLGATFFSAEKGLHDFSDEEVRRISTVTKFETRIYQSPPVTHSSRNCFWKACFERHQVSSRRFRHNWDKKGDLNGLPVELHEIHVSTWDPKADGTDELGNNYTVKW
ncbi:uncharacterized protein MKZ38_004956 [Zalerion maritima]|uniref:Heterokaryon incompatibility domain-containing protein n=1 Tax=Zalerion maritima TaxID=339359 RepID=A0AAD5RRJ9_9PEZI|nr:uncharacterized protein MKZ38_004956 [Zalerion maritima]